MEIIASRYQEQAQRSENSQESEQCEPGDDQRGSDLCAQWKAADAAADSAWWAARGTWVSGVSGALVLIAIGIAFQSNRIARETAKRQLRPYLHFESGSFTNRTDDEFLSVDYSINLKNGGQTPAVITKIAHCNFVQNGGGGAGGNGARQIVGIGQSYSIESGFGSQLTKISSRCVIHVGLRYEYASELGKWTEDVWLYGKGEMPDGKGRFKQGSEPNHPVVAELHSMFDETTAG